MIRCPNCGSKNTARCPSVSDLRKFTFRECLDCGYVGKWPRFRITKEELEQIKSYDIKREM